jgi:hypothetical protein
LKEDIGSYTVIGVGKLANDDGSVITSHSDCCSDCFVQIDVKKDMGRKRYTPEQIIFFSLDKHFINRCDIGPQKINLIFGRGESNLPFPSTSTKIGLVKA